MNLEGCIGLALALSVLSGCEMTQEKSLSPESVVLAPAYAAKIADIPVPRDFKLLPKESYSFESGAIRVAVLKYHGRARLDQAVRFYKEQMPLSDWTLLNIIEYENCLLNFDRDDETCIIDVSGRMSGVLVTISLGPKPSLVPRTARSRDTEKKKSPQ
jgi:hypothetical protein